MKEISGKTIENDELEKRARLLKNNVNQRKDII